MARTTRILQEVVEETFEYVNVTDSEGMRPEIMFFTTGDGKSYKKVLPGKSIFFTRKELEGHIGDGDERFLNGSIRAKDASESDLKTLKASDDMSEMVIEVLVRDVDSVRSFIGKLGKINSTVTINLFKKFVEKYDKPVSFMKACENRLNKIKEERDKLMRPQPMPVDEKAEQLSRR